MKLTEQGAKDIESAPDRIGESIAALEKMGGKLLGLWVTMGEYDYVSVAEAPSDEVAVTFLLGLGAGGNVRTTTLKAFTPEELAAIVAKLP